MNGLCHAVNVSLHYLFIYYYTISHQLSPIAIDDEWAGGTLPLTATFGDFDQVMLF